MGIPQSLAIDSAGNLYVLNGITVGTSITVYSPGASGDVAPIRTVTGLIQPPGEVGNLRGITIDSLGNLYLSKDSPGTIKVYPPGADGSVAPIRTISGGSSGVFYPSKMVFRFNSLYVSNGFNILVFDAGGAAPIRKIFAGISNNFDLAVDAAGLIYAGNFPDDFSAGSVTVYTASGSDDTPIRTIAGSDTKLGVPSGGIAISSAPVFSLSVTPPSVIGGRQNARGTFAIDRPSFSPIKAALFSVSPQLATVPSEATIPAGQQSVGFDVTTHAVTSPSDAIIRAFSPANYFVEAILGLLPQPIPGAVQDVTIDPPFIGLGDSDQSAQCTVTIVAPATPRAVRVALSSLISPDRPEVRARFGPVPQSITIPSGATSFSFTITLFPWHFPTPSFPRIIDLTISATAGGVTKEGYLTLSSVRPRP